MPLPLFLGIGAAIAGAIGVGTSINGAVKMKNANNLMKSAKNQHEQDIKKFETKNKETTEVMDELGKLELEILHSFSDFSDIFEQIKNRPIFENYTRKGITLPRYDGEKIKEVSVGAGVLLGGLGGAGLGTAGGFAAAGATTAAVMALGTASTGTAIASLSGAAATNATLAALGGGALAAGGGGIALGTTILGATTLGVALLVGGVIFNFTGNKISNKADKAFRQMEKAKIQIDKICKYLNKLKSTSIKYYDTLIKVNSIYSKNLKELENCVNVLGHKDWNQFSDEEKMITENTVLLVGVLYNMCKVELVIQAKSNDEINTINEKAIDESINQANVLLAEDF